VIVSRTLKTRLPEAIATGIIFWVMFILQYPFIDSVSSIKPPIAYLWRDRKLTFARYVLAMTGLLIVFMIASEIIIRSL
jgi:hypothetical protein